MDRAADLSTSASVWLALGLTAVLAALHLLAPRIRTLPGVPEHAMTSFSGGLAVAYVFLHLLPDLATGSAELGEALADVLSVTPLLDLAIFAVALGGFSLYYGLERWAGSGGGEDTPGLFRLHLASFGLYNALITYTMPTRLQAGIGFAVLFTVAMALHFALIDRGMEEHYPRRFEDRGRFVLAGSLVLGWVLAAVLAPTSTLFVVLLSAFLAGSILLNVFKEELPSGRRSSFPWFLAGAVLYGGLLVLVTALEH